MRVRIAGALTATQKPAIARAKTYRGRAKFEWFAECIIWYKNGVATIIPLSRDLQVFGTAQLSKDFSPTHHMQYALPGLRPAATPTTDADGTVVPHRYTCSASGMYELVVPPPTADHLSLVFGVSGTEINNGESAPNPPPQLRHWFPIAKYEVVTIDDVPREQVTLWWVDAYFNGPAGQSKLMTSVWLVAADTVLIDPTVRALYAWNTVYEHWQRNDMHVPFEDISLDLRVIQAGETIYATAIISRQHYASRAGGMYWEWDSTIAAYVVLDVTTAEASKKQLGVLPTTSRYNYKIGGFIADDSGNTYVIIHGGVLAGIVSVHVPFEAIILSSAGAVTTAAIMDGLYLQDWCRTAGSIYAVDTVTGDLGAAGLNYKVVTISPSGISTTTYTEDRFTIQDVMTTLYAGGAVGAISSTVYLSDRPIATYYGGIDSYTDIVFGHTAAGSAIFNMKLYDLWLPGDPRYYYNEDISAGYVGVPFSIDVQHRPMSVTLPIHADNGVTIATLLVAAGGWSHEVNYIPFSYHIGVMDCGADVLIAGLGTDTHRRGKTITPISIPRLVNNEVLVFVGGVCVGAADMILNLQAAGAFTSAELAGMDRSSYPVMTVGNMGTREYGGYPEGCKISVLGNYAVGLIPLNLADVGTTCYILFAIDKTGAIVHLSKSPRTYGDASLRAFRTFSKVFFTDEGAGVVRAAHNHGAIVPELAGMVRVPYTTVIYDFQRDVISFYHSSDILYNPDPHIIFDGVVTEAELGTPRWAFDTGAHSYVSGYGVYAASGVPVLNSCAWKARDQKLYEILVHRAGSPPINAGLAPYAEYTLPVLAAMKAVLYPSA